MWLFFHTKNNNWREKKDKLKREGWKRYQYQWARDIQRHAHIFVCCLRHPQPGSHTHQKQRDEASIFPWLNNETHKGVPRTNNRGSSVCEGIDSQCIMIIRANDPSAGSPTETLLRLLLPLSVKVHQTFHSSIQELKTAAVRIIHRNTQSVGATGGVYKGQGRNQYELMTRAY